MIRSPRSIVLITTVMALAGCANPDDSPGPGGMTDGENDRLEQAAERLDARAPSPAQDSAATLEAQVEQGIAAEQANR